MPNQRPNVPLSERKGLVSRLTRCLFQPQKAEWLALLEEESLPPALRERVLADARNAAASAHPSTSSLSRARRMKMKRFALVAVFVMLLSTGGYWWLTGRQQDTAMAMAQVAEAMAQVKSVHFTGWQFDAETGKRMGKVECWVKGANKFRLDQGSLQIADDGTQLATVERGDPTTALLQPSGQYPGLTGGLTYLNLFAGTQGFKKTLEARGARVMDWQSGTLPEGGCVDILELDIGLAKAKLYFDASTKRLAQWEVYDLHGRLEQQLETIEYDLEVPDSVFSVKIPEGAVVTDLRTPEPPAKQAERDRLQRAVEMGQYGRPAGICSIPSGSCGSPYHDNMRFRTLSPAGLKAWYVQERNSYFVAGRAWVSMPKPGRSQLVEDAEVAAPGPPDHAVEQVRAQELPPVPAEVTAKREAKAKELLAAGAKFCSSFGAYGMGGTTYHAGIYFEVMDPYNMSYYYLPDRNVYYVIGKARIYSLYGKGSTQVVEDGEFALPEQAKTIQ